MNYLQMIREGATATEVHRAVDRNSRSTCDAVSRLDQYDSLVREVLAVAGDNAGLGGDRVISQIKQRALKTRNDSDLPEGSLRVVRISPTNPSTSIEFAVTDGRPVASTAPVGYCNVCSEPHSQCVAFLYPAGVVIVQVDMCPSCADRYVAKGHKPYMLVALRRFLEASDGD